MAWLVAFCRAAGRVLPWIANRVRSIPLGELSIADLLFLAGSAGIEAFGHEVASDYALAAARRVRTERSLLVDQMRAASSILNQRDWSKVRARLLQLNNQLDGSTLPEPPKPPKKPVAPRSQGVSLVSLPTPPDLLMRAAAEFEDEAATDDLDTAVRNLAAIADGRADEGISADVDPLVDALKQLEDE